MDPVARAIYEDPVVSDPCETVFFVFIFESEFVFRGAYNKL